MQPTPQCIDWTGNQSKEKIRGINLPQNLTENIRKLPLVKNWNCTQVYNCSMNATELQRLGPLARALRLGCLCQNYLSSTKDTWTGTTIKGKIIHCD